MMVVFTTNLMQFEWQIPEWLPLISLQCTLICQIGQSILPPLAISSLRRCAYAAHSHNSSGSDADTSTLDSPVSRSCTLKTGKSTTSYQPGSLNAWPLQTTVWARSFFALAGGSAKDAAGVFQKRRRGGNCAVKITSHQEVWGCSRALESWRFNQCLDKIVKFSPLECHYDTISNP